MAPQPPQEHLLRAVLEASLNGVMALESVRNEQGRIVDFRWTLVNRAAGALVGRPPEELIGKRLLEEMPGNDEDGLFADYVTVVETQRELTVDQRYDHPDEGFPSKCFRIQAVPNGDGFVVTFIDVSDEHEMSRKLAEREARLRHIVDNATDMMSLHAADGTYEYVTPACERLIGWTRAELIGRNAYEFFHPEDLAAIQASHDSVVAKAEAPASARYRIRKADGSYTWFETTSKTIAEDGRIICVSRDVTETVRLEKMLEELTRQDPLTGLANRRELMRRAGEEVRRARRYEQPLSLVALDVDHFKQINDRWGHQGGDQALKALSAVLEASSRDTDLAARTGGEEFVVLLPDTPLDGAIVFAERLRAALADVTVDLDQGTLTMTASLGVAELADGDAEALLRAADECLYAAKRGGRNRVMAVATGGATEATDSAQRRLLSAER